MSEQPDTKTPAEPEILPILAWQVRLGTKRDLLCLAATMRAWDPRQETDTLDETCTTQAEYEAAVKEARALYDKLRTPNEQKRVTRPGQVAVFCHPTQLLAIVVRKPNKDELFALQGYRADKELSKEETNEKFTFDLQERLLWPTKGSPELARILEEEPGSFHTVFPYMVLEYVGVDLSIAHRRG